MDIRLLFVVVNWRNTFQTCPLLQQAGGSEVGRRDSVLAGAGVCNSFSSPPFPCWLLQRGFFAGWIHGTVSEVSPGGLGSGSCMAFLVRKNGRGPDQESKLIRLYSIQPDAGSPAHTQGEPHRNQPRRS